MKNIALKVAYDGVNYHGYQAQPGLVTVEGRLRQALRDTFHEEVDLVSAGRTDRGVHALGQVVNIKVDNPIDLGNLPRVLNYHLPEDISVLGAKEVDWDFHARFSAKAKLYRYVIYNGRYRSPLYHQRACFVYDPLDEQKMEEALNYLGQTCSHIHVSFDMDVLDPEVAPGTGTKVPGGMDYREGHLCLESVAQTGKLVSCEFVEVNPILDHENKTAKAAVALAGSLLGEWLI